jgi:acetyl-CoA acyltransferase 1
LQKNDNDVVIVFAVRTAITKVRFIAINPTQTKLFFFQAKKGESRETHPELMLSHVLCVAYTQLGLDPTLIEDVAVGTVLQAGGGASASRMAALHAGIPYTTSLNTVNRQCSGGLSTVNQIANQIKDRLISALIRLRLSSS